MPSRVARVQKIFDDLKNRQDVQVLIVSTDDNIAVVAPFVTRRQYTFPVISVSSALIDKMVGIEGIPRTWIVDAAGSVRFELIGYEPTLWPDQILKQLAAVK